MFLNISQENTCAIVSILIELQVSTSNCIKKEILVQVFSCEIFKNIFLDRRSPVAASVKNLPVPDTAAELSFWRCKTRCAQRRFVCKKNNLFYTGMCLFSYS